MDATQDHYVERDEVDETEENEEGFHQQSKIPSEDILEADESGPDAENEHDDSEYDHRVSIYLPAYGCQRVRPGVPV